MKSKYSLTVGKVLGSVIEYLILFLLSILFLYPFLWMISTAFKPSSTFFKQGLALIPKPATLENFIRVWSEANFGLYFFNTVVVTLVVIILVLCITTLCGYVLGRYDFAGKKLVYAMFVASICIPGTTTIIPLYKIISSIGLNGTRTGLILATIGGGHVVFILLFQSAFHEIPKEMEESALLDGCGFCRLFMNIMLPLVKPIVSTVVIMQTIWTWNDFLLPLVLTLSNAASRTLAVGLYVFQGENTIDWTGICAGASISIVPVIILYMFMQKYFVAGLAGAVKG